MFKRLMRWLCGPEPIEVAAEYVVAELLMVIDSLQDFEGWAHRYRGHFQYDYTAFETLGDGLDTLCRLLGRDPRLSSPQLAVKIEAMMDVCRKYDVSPERLVTRGGAATPDRHGVHE